MNPRRVVMALTYAPKIKAVRAEDCNQTIRINKHLNPGDIITFHGWTGKPYRSPWNWRKEVIVKELWDIEFNAEGFKLIAWRRPSLIIETVRRLVSWDSEGADSLAAKDCIDPPTGLALRDTLFKLGNLKEGRTYEGQVIRWYSAQELEAMAGEALKKSARPLNGGGNNGPQE